VRLPFQASFGFQAADVEAGCRSSPAMCRSSCAVSRNGRQVVPAARKAESCPCGQKELTQRSNWSCGCFVPTDDRPQCMQTSLLLRWCLPIPDSSPQKEKRHSSPPHTTRRSAVPRNRGPVRAHLQLNPLLCQERRPVDGPKRRVGYNRFVTEEAIIRAFTPSELGI
jgi:hypothetical protein